MSTPKKKSVARQLTRRQVKSFRKSQGWSATRLGLEMANGLPRGYSRSYVKAIEGGSLPSRDFSRSVFACSRAGDRRASAKQGLGLPRTHAEAFDYPGETETLSGVS